MRVSLTALGHLGTELNIVPRNHTQQKASRTDSAGSQLSTLLPARFVTIAARAVVHEPASVLGLRPGLVHREVATLERMRVELGDGLRRLLVTAHFDERESA